MIDFTQTMPMPPPALGDDEVHICYAPLARTSAQIMRLRALLSNDERERADRFYFDKDRNNYTVARALLRLILAPYVGIEAQALEFGYGARGKPFVPAPQALHFNLSHSHMAAIYAVSRHDIGVDIEYHHREVSDLSAIARRFFAPAESAVLHALPRERWQAAFFNCWTRKEAYIKAVGDGLSLGLDQFEVSLEPDAPARFISIGGDRARAAQWSLFDLRPAAGYTAALAVPAPHCHIHCWQWCDIYENFPPVGMDYSPLTPGGASGE